MQNLDFGCGFLLVTHLPCCIGKGLTCMDQNLSSRLFLLANVLTPVLDSRVR